MERRSFLRNFTFAGALVAVPAVSTLAKTPKVSSGINGKVHRNGKGIAHVPVTDGHNIVLTDNSGRYELQPHDDAEFVYITLPRGYKIPEHNGIAQFYHPLQGNTTNFDFALEPVDGDDTNHCFVVWADTQMISKEDCEQLKRESVPDLVALTKTYPAGTLFHGIGCGDLVWDKFDLFQDYREAVGATGVPFFNVIGNHDMDIDALGDDGSDKTFKQQFGPTYYSFNRGAIHYIVLDDVFFLGTAKKYIGHVSEAQLHWLKKDLANVAPGSTVVVSLHIPTNTGAARRNKKEEEMGGTVTNRKRLYDILKPYKVHFMSGHTHFNESWEQDNMMEHNHGTVCGAWWTGPICGDGTPSGYGVYEVTGSDIKWYYKSTGKPREHQLRLYDKGRLRSAPDEISANVWNWDTKWKVEWFEDDVAKGEMEQRIALDPWSIELYEGPQLPKKHKFVEPTLADHMFFAKPSATAKKITVVATDRFGVSYKEELLLN